MCFALFLYKKICNIEEIVVYLQKNYQWKSAVLALRIGSSHVENRQFSCRESSVLVSGIVSYRVENRQFSR